MSVSLCFYISVHVFVSVRKRSMCVRMYVSAGLSMYVSIVLVRSVYQAVGLFVFEVCMWVFSIYVCVYVSVSVVSV